MKMMRSSNGHLNLKENQLINLNHTSRNDFLQFSKFNQGQIYYVKPIKQERFDMSFFFIW